MAEWEIVLCAECGTPTTAQVSDGNVRPPMEACRCGSSQFDRVTGRGD